MTAEGLPCVGVLRRSLRKTEAGLRRALCVEQRISGHPPEARTSKNFSEAVLRRQTLDIPT